ncbi:MAG: glycosyltransferase [Candidatus Aminicenantes bacterium]|nr:glycosyltransferase [Candidatus Aminicenantes bacterium]
MKNGQRSVVISDPHLFHPFRRFGGYQYAQVFARYGWRVILLSASFTFWRTLARNPGIGLDYVQLWRSRGRRIEENLTNYGLSHWLPRRVRFAWPFRRFAHALYVPGLPAILRREGMEQVDLLWLHGNEDWLYRRAVPHRKLVVRVFDNYSGFAMGYRNDHPLMRETLAAADGVFTCTQYVRDLYRGLRPDITVIPNGVDFERFRHAAAPEPPFLAAIPRPRAVYVGAVAAWFDLDLVLALARRLPTVQFVVAGPWSRRMPPLSACPVNLHLPGPLPYDSIPALLAGCDVGLVPFSDNDLVRGVSPIKVYEYLAAGLPTVSSYWRELESESLPIALARDLDGFVAGVEAALGTPAAAKDALRDYARRCSWEQRLREMLNKVGVPLADG